MPSAKDTKTGAVEPAICEIALSADQLLRALLGLPSHQRLSILDSCNARDASARFLIAGFDPFEIIEARGSKLRVTQRGQSGEQVLPGDALKSLDERLARYLAPPHAPPPPPHDDLPATGACIATFSYELGYQLERLRLRAGRELADEPDMVLAFYDTLVIHDYARGVTRVTSVGGRKRLDETVGALTKALNANDVFES
ncbi:MAG TPA: hypothetical protein VEV81_06430, partial [Pyrinomonadaceae bacterium]|nr:hypothetical protein [Pyrinomonadaceae bacterium]